MGPLFVPSPPRLLSLADPEPPNWSDLDLRRPRDRRSLEPWERLLLSERPALSKRLTLGVPPALEAGASVCGRPFVEVRSLAGAMSSGWAESAPWTRSLSRERTSVAIASLVWTDVSGSWAPTTKPLARLTAIIARRAHLAHTISFMDCIGFIVLGC